MPSVLTEEQQREYHENGFVVAHVMFSLEEIDPWRRAMAEDPKIAAPSLIRPEVSKAF